MMMMMIINDKFFEGFPLKLTLVVSQNKFHHVTRTLLSILAYFNNAVVGFS